MREIKFRVWDKQNMRYRDTEEFAVTGTGRLLHLSSIYGDYNEVDDVDRYEVEIGTGLKDVDGVEIYEGDILEDPFGRCEVVWVQEQCSCLLLTKTPSGFWRLECGHANYTLETTEVIGNVHDNPDEEAE